MLNIFNNSINGHLLNCPITSLDCLSENISVESQPVVRVPNALKFIEFFQSLLEVEVEDATSRID